VTGSTIERVAEEDGTAIFEGMEWRLFVRVNAGRAKGVYQE
jgi:hypothetical protein